LGLGNLIYEKQKISIMDNQILAHTKYNCTYHIVFIPKYRRKVMYGKIGKEVGGILSAVCKITGMHLIKGGICPDHVHLYASIPPKMGISDVMSKLKGKGHL
jgi:putative transposase